MTSSPSVLVTAGLLGLFAACTPAPAPGPVPGTDYAALLRDHPVSKRYPPPTLPWKARARAVVSRKVEYLDEGLVFPAMVEMQGALVAVAARDGNVAVVFPPEDREGFDLAVAGVDHPWSRTHLLDTPAERIGTVDAVGGADGTLHVVFREQGGGALTHVAVTRAGEVTAEPIPRPSTLPDGAAYSTCDDVAVGVTPAGDVDVVYQHLHEHAVRFQVVVAHRAPGGGWTNDVALDTIDAVSDPALPVWGCRSRLAYDEDWKPFVATLVSSVRAGNWGHHAITLLTGADGHMYRGPYDIAVDDAGPWYRPDFDVARAPAGFVVSAHHTSKYWSFLRPTFLRGVTGFAVPEFETGGSWGEKRGTWHKEAARDGGGLGFTPCFTPELWTARPGLMPAETVTYGTGGCNTPLGHAPVLGPSRAITGVLARTFTHGIDPFRAALCVYEDNALAICRGGFSFQDEEELRAGKRRFLEPEEVVKITSSSIPNGAVDVPEDTKTITITLSDWKQAVDSHVGATLFDDVVGVDAARQPDVESDRATKTVTLHLPHGLAPGRSYMIHLPTSVQDDVFWPAWFGVVQAPPVLRFKVRGSFRDESWDPRNQPIRLDGCSSRDPGGRCVVDVEGGSRLAFKLPLTRHGRLAPGDVSSLWAPGDVRIEPLRLTTSEENGRIYLNMDTDLTAALDTTWQLNVGELVDTQYGTRLPTEDRTILVRSGAGPPRLIASQPADGAADVAVDAVLRLTFNADMQYASITPQVTLRPASGGGPVPISILQEDARTYRLGHDPLEPRTTYRIDVPAEVRDTQGRAPVAAASVTFTTGGAP